MTKPGVVFVGAAQLGLPTVTPSRVPSMSAWAFAAPATSFTDTASGVALIISTVVEGPFCFDLFAADAWGAKRNPTAKLNKTTPDRHAAPLRRSANHDHVPPILTRLV